MDFCSFFIRQRMKLGLLLVFGFPKAFGISRGIAMTLEAAGAM